MSRSRFQKALAICFCVSLFCYRAAALVPTVTTLTATNVTLNSAALGGLVNPNAQSTTVWFQWGTNTSYGSFTTSNAIGSGPFNVGVSNSITGLQTNTTYHFRCVAANPSGQATGLDQSFVTALPPTVSTLAATLRATNGATLNGNVNPNGLPATGWFEWGTNVSYGNTTAPVSLGSGTNGVAINFSATALNPGMIYHFRASGSNSAGVVHAVDKTFRPSPSLFLVTSLADNGPGSLRQSIVSSVSGDFIYFATNGMIVLTNGELLITNNLTIAGPGPTNLAVSGNNQSRVFEISSNGNVFLSGITIRDGLTSNGADSTTNNPAAGNGTDGGGLYNSGTLAMSNCVVTANQTGHGGNGVAAPGGAPGGAGGNGAGIYSGGNLTLLNCVIRGNTNGSGGYAGLTSGSAGWDGGAGGFGGGIFTAGPLSATGCLITSNCAGMGGLGGPTENGAGYGGFGGTGGFGGGLYSTNAVTLTNCTIVGNVAGAGGRGGDATTAHHSGYGGFGGWGGGGVFGGSSVTFLASTISGNSAGAGGDAGTFGNQSASQVGIGGDGGGISGDATLRSSIVASNRPGINGLYGLTSPPSVGADVYGSLISQGHNLIGQLDNAAATGFTNGLNADIVGTTNSPIDPGLLPLSDNGGPTLTMALLANSPAFEAGDDAVLDFPYNLSIDQRGFPRKSGAHVDIGAFELDVSALHPPTVVTLNVVVGSVSATTGTASATLNASVNPNSAPTTAYFQFGLTTNYGGITAFAMLGFGTNALPTSESVSGIGAGLTYHYRAVGTNALGITFGADATFVPPSPYLLGDINGDGIVDQDELNEVYSNYLANSPWLYLTNTAGLGGTNVLFSLASNSIAGSYSVLYSTNLTDWNYLGPATTRYLFTDTNAPASPQRYYRLSYP